MITIDGSQGEGGGSLVRVALAYSVLFQKAVTITNIRSGRPNPGLKNQHLFCIKALEKLCNAKVEHAELGSEKLHFVPGKIQGQTIDIDIETAGSISLFLQGILIPALFANKPVTLNIIGGTDTKWAAPIDYFKEIFVPHIQKFADVSCNMEKRGYYPKGQGKFSITIKPKYKLFKFETLELFFEEIKKNIPAIRLTEQGNLVQIKGTSHASSDLQDAHVAERQAKASEVTLSKLDTRIQIQKEYSEAASTGSGITLWAIYSKNDEINLNNPVKLGADCLGERGKKAEDVGIEAAHNLLNLINSTAAVDSYLADQLIPFMALLPGSTITASEITNHTKTNIHVVEQFFGQRFHIENNTISVTQ